jgi:predicted NACHT family NTPase
MAERPLLLTIMAMLQTSFGQLPEDRVELYQWVVDLLFRRWKGDADQGEKDLLTVLDMPGLKLNDLLIGMSHVAFLAHTVPFKSSWPPPT